jgi:hypothetical protein
MKNKLLLTTAITSLALTGFANAETKVTGDMTMSYNALAGYSGTSKSSDSWGKESQINISNSGDLNNGMKYAAGFSLEFDGGPTSAKTTDISNENFYIDFISGGTTISLSQDHGLHTDSNAVPRVSVPYNSVGAGSDLLYRNGAKLGNGFIDVKESTGVFIAQKFDGGVLQARRVKSLNNTVSQADNAIDTSNPEGGAYDIIFVGDAGVKGLSLNLQYAGADKKLNSSYTSARSTNSSLISAAYNFGKVAIGAARNKREVGTATDLEYTTQEIGATLAASDNLSIGVNYAKTDKSTASVDEKASAVQLGYNLGAVAIAVGYQKIDNQAATAGSDTESAFLRVSTKF